MASTISSTQRSSLSLPASSAHAAPTLELIQHDKTISVAPRTSDDALQGAEGDNSPAATFAALTNVSGPLQVSIAAATPAERAFGIRAAAASAKIEEWLLELSSWPWPKEAGSNGFLSCEPRDGQPVTTFCGSLLQSDVLRYDSRTHFISSALLDLDVEGLKKRVLESYTSGDRSLGANSSTTTHGSDPTSSRKFSKHQYRQMDDFTATVTAIVLRTLPSLSRLNALLSIWAVRLLVLKGISPLLEAADNVDALLQSCWTKLADSQSTADAVDEALKSSAVVQPDYDALIAMQINLKKKISSLGSRLDRMLDSLEGRQDSLPEAWLDRMEDIEHSYSEWVAAVEKRICQNKWAVQATKDSSESAINTLAYGKIALGDAAVSPSPSNVLEGAVTDTIPMTRAACDAGARIDTLQADVSGDRQLRHHLPDISNKRPDLLIPRKAGLQCAEVFSAQAAPMPEQIFDDQHAQHLVSKTSLDQSTVLKPNLSKSSHSPKKLPRYGSGLAKFLRHKFQDARDDMIDSGTFPVHVARQEACGTVEIVEGYHGSVIQTEIKSAGREMVSEESKNTNNVTLLSIPESDIRRHNRFHSLASTVSGYRQRDPSPELMDVLPLEFARGTVSVARIKRMSDVTEPQTPTAVYDEPMVSISSVEVDERLLALDPLHDRFPTLTRRSAPSIDVMTASEMLKESSVPGCRLNDPRLSPGRRSKYGANLPNESFESLSLLSRPFAVGNVQLSNVPRPLSGTSDMTVPRTSPDAIPGAVSTTTVEAELASCQQFLHCNSEGVSEIFSDMKEDKQYPKAAEYQAEPPRTPSLGMLRSTGASLRNEDRSDTGCLPLESPPSAAPAVVSVTKRTAVDARCPPPNLQHKISQIISSIPIEITLASPVQKQTLGTLLVPKRRKHSTGFRAMIAQTPPKAASFTLVPAATPTETTPNSSVMTSLSGSETKLYCLFQPNHDKPVKLLVRLVGEHGERVMVRVGGGWADFKEWLIEYASHHSQRSASLSASAIRIYDYADRRRSAGWASGDGDATPSPSPLGDRRAPDLEFRPELRKARRSLDAQTVLQRSSTPDGVQDSSLAERSRFVTPSHLSSTFERTTSLAKSAPCRKSALRATPSSTLESSGYHGAGKKMRRATSGAETATPSSFSADCVSIAKKVLPRPARTHVVV